MQVFLLLSSRCYLLLKHTFLVLLPALLGLPGSRWGHVTSAMENTPCSPRRWVSPLWPGRLGLRVPRPGGMSQATSLLASVLLLSPSCSQKPPAVSVCLRCLSGLPQVAPPWVGKGCGEAGLHVCSSVFSSGFRCNSTYQLG